MHQNVPAVSGDKQTKFGHQKYQGRLENCEGKYHSFQDVIMFKEATDIAYFPGLRKGDPPMAPVNPGYSEKALHLKSALVSLADETKPYSNFAAFQVRVEKLWIAVCQENYIFSFKNALEITAYNELDARFSKWTWLLHCGLLEWQYETGNKVSNCPPDQISAVVAECNKKQKLF